MEKLKGFIGYIYCFIVIIISIFIMVRMEFLSRYILRGLREEFLPVISMDKSKGDDLLYEVIPMLAIGNEEYSDEPDLSYDDFGDYDYSAISSFGVDGGFSSDNKEAVSSEEDEDTNIDSSLTEQPTESVPDESTEEPQDNLYVMASAGMNPNGIYYSMEQ